jgi:hypothetical protein
MKRVRFVSDANAILESGPQTLFNTGDVQDLNPASADRWIRRGVAVDDPDGKVGKAAKKAAKAEDGKKDSKSAAKAKE